MSRPTNGQKSANGVKDGPVKAGSVLRHALELIAREVAKDLGGAKSSPKPSPKH